VTTLVYQPAQQFQLPLEDLADRAQRFAESSTADSTRRAYASDLRDFGAFCLAHALAAFPASPQTVATYVADLAPRAKASTLRRRLAAIAVTHRRAGLESPSAHRIVRDVVSGVLRQNGSAPKRADALTLDPLTAMLLAVKGDDVAARRDRAILLLGFAGALRRSEIAALRVEDLRFTKQGMLVRIVRSKTDQLGEGQEIAVPTVATEALCAVRAVRGWLDAAGITTGPLFRSLSPHRNVQDAPISGRDVSNLIQRLARRARLEGDFSGHSLRAGFATSAAQAKVPLDVIMRTTRHRSLAVLQGYIRRADAFDAPALSSIIR
jgi:integrase